MKTKIAKPILSAVLMMCCTVMNAQYETFQAGGIMYTVTGKNTVEVGKNENLSGSVVIPATVTNDSKTYNVTGIGNIAFFSNEGITSVTIPEGVTYIGNGAFDGTKLTSISLPEGLISIGDYAFHWCENLEGDLVLPSTVKSIGVAAFKWCSDLTSVTIKGGSIGDEAFSSCSGLTSISLQEGVTSIGLSAFSGCNHIEGDLVIPSTVKNIGNGAFENCSGLTSVTIKGGSIGNEAFKGCAYIESISLQEGVTSIGANAFSDSGLLVLNEDYLIIPSTVKSIGGHAFENVLVNSIKVFALVPPELGDNAFWGYTNGFTSLYVPDVERYKECDGWKDFLFIELLTDFKLGDQIYTLNETGDYLDQNLTFNDKDSYVSGLDFTVKRLTYSRTFKDTNWQALYVPFAISYSDWSNNFDVATINNFHEYTDDMGQTVKTELEVRLVKDHTLKPNHPYLIRAKMADNYNPQEINLSTKELCKSEENSIVCSSVEREYTFTGTYQDVTGMKTKDYIFMSGGKLCKAVDDGVKLSAQRWYLTVESLGSQFDDDDPSYARAMEFDIKLLNDEATGIDEITVTRTPLTDDSETIYNLNGMRVSDSYKGIVIKNGKKIYQW